MPPSPDPRPIALRVQERVDAAAAILSAHDGRARLGHAPAPAVNRNSLERRALDRVFREMGRNQRATRRETGQPPSPVVREAALAYRRAPSLPALVLVAASLDEAGLLAW